MRGLKVDFLPAQLDGTLILVVNAEQAFHQSRLTGTVLAHQCMDCAGAYIEIHPFERLHTGKCFGNAAHFQQVFLRSRCSGLFLLCRTHFSAPFWVFFIPNWGGVPRFLGTKRAQSSPALVPLHFAFYHSLPVTRSCNVVSRHYIQAA